MEDHFNDYKQEATSKFRSFLLQLGMYAVIAFVIYWLWRAFVNDYGLIGKTLSEALVIITLDAFLFICKYFGTIALIYSLYLFFSYRRKVQAELIKIKKFQSFLINLKKKQKLNLSLQEGLKEELNKEIEKKEIRLPNDQLEAVLEKRVNELSELSLPDSYPVESMTESKIRNLRQYPLYSEEINRFIKEQKIPYHFLSDHHHYVRKYESKVFEAYHLFNKHLGIISSGNRGEERVDQELKQFSYFSRFLSNVRLEVDGSSIETDHILFSTKGIFLFEVKNFSESGKYSLRITKDGQWQRIYPNGEIKPMEKDVTAQHNRHLFLLEKFIRDEWQKMYGEQAPIITLYPLIVIANDTIMIENQTEVPVIRISQIYHHVQKIDDMLSQHTVDQLEQLITQHQLPLKTYPIADYTEGLRNYKEMLNQIHELDLEMSQLIEKIAAVVSEIEEKSL